MSYKFKLSAGSGKLAKSFKKMIPLYWKRKRQKASDVISKITDTAKSINTTRIRKLQAARKALLDKEEESGTHGLAKSKSERDNIDLILASLDNIEQYLDSNLVTQFIEGKELLKSEELESLFNSVKMVGESLGNLKESKQGLLDNYKLMKSQLESALNSGLSNTARSESLVNLLKIIETSPTSVNPDDDLVKSLLDALGIEAKGSDGVPLSGKDRLALISTSSIEELLKSFEEKLNENPANIEKSLTDLSFLEDQFKRIESTNNAIESFDLNFDELSNDEVVKLLEEIRDNLALSVKEDHPLLMELNTKLEEGEVSENEAREIRESFREYTKKQDDIHINSLRDLDDKFKDSLTDSEQLEETLKKQGIANLAAFKTIGGYLKDKGKSSLLGGMSTMWKLLLGAGAIGLVGLSQGKNGMLGEFLDLVVGGVGEVYDIAKKQVMTLFKTDENGNSVFSNWWNSTVQPFLDDSWEWLKRQYDWSMKFAEAQWDKLIDVHLPNIGRGFMDLYDKLFSGDSDFLSDLDNTMREKYSKFFKFWDEEFFPWIEDKFIAMWVRIDQWMRDNIVGYDMLAGDKPDASFIGLKGGERKAANSITALDKEIKALEHHQEWGSPLDASTWSVDLGFTRLETDAAESARLRVEAMKKELADRKARLARGEYKTPESGANYSTESSSAISDTRSTNTISETRLSNTLEITKLESSIATTQKELDKLVKVKDISSVATELQTKAKEMEVLQKTLSELKQKSARANYSNSVIPVATTQVSAISSYQSEIAKIKVELAGTSLSPEQRSQRESSVSTLQNAVSSLKNPTPNQASESAIPANAPPPNSSGSYVGGSTSPVIGEDSSGLSTGSGDQENIPEHVGVQQGIPDSSGGLPPITKNVNRFDGLFIKWGNKYGVDPIFLKTMAWQESAGLDKHINSTNSVGAGGLMQFMPNTAKEYGINRFNPNEAVKGAAMYLKQALKKFDGDYVRAAASYNTGKGRGYLKHKDWYHRLTNDKRKFTRETFHYVRDVAGNYFRMTGKLLPTTATNLNRQVTTYIKAGNTAAMSKRGMKPSTLIAKRKRGKSHGKAKATNGSQYKASPSTPATSMPNTVSGSSSGLGSSSNLSALTGSFEGNYGNQGGGVSSMLDGVSSMFPNLDPNSEFGKVISMARDAVNQVSQGMSGSQVTSGVSPNSTPSNLGITKPHEVDTRLKGEVDKMQKAILPKVISPINSINGGINPENPQVQRVFPSTPSSPPTTGKYSQNVEPEPVDDPQLALLANVVLRVG